MGRTTLSTPKKKAAPHNHRNCVRDALLAAERVCEERNLKLTPLRRQVLEIVWSRHEPIGAYDILGVLSSAEHRPSPPTVYRALEFLLEAGLVHRIDSLNAFKGCESPESGHRAQFLVCRSCHHVEELDDRAIEAAIGARAKSVGFSISAGTLEIRGLCQQCTPES